MNIPDKAIGAAEEAWCEAADLEDAIKAAAPYIAGQALHDYADSLERWFHIEGPLTIDDILSDMRNTRGG